MFVPVWMWHMVLHCHQLPSGNAQEADVEGLPGDSYTGDLVGVKTSLTLMEQHFPRYPLQLVLCIDGVLHPVLASPSLGESYLPGGSSRLCSWNFYLLSSSAATHEALPTSLCLIVGSKDNRLKTRRIKAPCICCLLPRALRTVEVLGALWR